MCKFLIGSHCEFMQWDCPAAMQGFGAESVGNTCLANTTPHPVTVLNAAGEVVLRIPAAERPLRLPEETFPAGIEVAGVQVVDKKLNAAELPPAIGGVFYIVSLPVAQAVRRPDFLVPDDLVRDEEGRVTGCRRFARLV